MVNEIAKISVRNRTRGKNSSLSPRKSRNFDPMKTFSLSDNYDSFKHETIDLRNKNILRTSDKKSIVFTADQLLSTENSYKMKIKLPEISKVRLHLSSKTNFNPLTQALYNYRDNLDAYHPNTYPANLTIFETHDLIEHRYAKK